MTVITIVIRLCLATVLGGLVGMERENKRRAAGFRTHILVSAGSALVMITSEYIFYEYRGVTNIDPARLGAQVISGIGFLGAGTIIRQGGSVKGLTTAASLWAVSCIGLAVGIGFYEAAAVATAIVCITLVLLSRFEKLVVKRREYAVEICMEIDNCPTRIGEITTLIGSMNVNIRSFKLEGDDEKSVLAKFKVQLPKGMTKERFMENIEKMKGITII